jgi:hypothetical protein
VLEQAVASAAAPVMAAARRPTEAGAHGVAGNGLAPVMVGSHVGSDGRRDDSIYLTCANRYIEIRRLQAFSAARRLKRRSPIARRDSSARMIVRGRAS